MTHHRSTSRRVMLAVTAGLVLLLTGCAGPSAPHTPTDSDAEFFFGGAIDTYGQSLSETDHDAAVISRALRRVDVCGFVDVPAISAAIPNITSYGPNPNPTTCTLTLKTDDPRPPGTTIRLELRTDVPDWTHARAKFVDVKVGNITMKKGEDCNYFLPLGLEGLTGAPTSQAAAEAMRRQYVEITPYVLGSVTCEQLTAVATAAAKTQERGIPRLGPQSNVWNPVLLDDPCSIFPDLTGYSGYVPTVAAARSCAFTPNVPHDATISAAITLDTVHALDASFTTEKRDGVTLHVEPDYQPGNYHDCRIEVGVSSPLKPAAGNTAAPVDDQKSWQRPVVLVRGHANCDAAKSVAVAAAKKLS
jgi:hypothetical protein